MKFWFTILLYLVCRINCTLQVCTTKQVFNPRYYLHDISLMNFGGHCEKVNFTNNFSSEIKISVEPHRFDWLEINNTDSPKIPKGTFQGVQISDLRINNANVRDIEIGAFRIRRLTKLSLRNNKISALPKGCFAELYELETLDLSSNKLLDVEGSFEGLKSLHKLDLNNNLISKLSAKTFLNLTRIDYLDLSFNKISSLDGKTFSKLPHLSVLLLNSNDLKDLPSNLFLNNSQLDIVSISENFFTGLTQLTFSNSLKMLNVSHNTIQTLSFIGKHQHVEVLDCSYNDEISYSLSPDLLKNVTVSELYLDNNNIGLNPLKVKGFYLENLKTISLLNNGIKKIDSNLFESNVVLTRLNLSQNLLKELDSSKFPKTIQNLSLSHNCFDTIPNVSSLQNLIALDLSYNNITNITFYSFEGLKLLKFLYLQNNRILTLAVGCFRDLSNLNSLLLSNNNIGALETGVFAKLNSLQLLGLSHNELERFTDGVFHNLRALKLLDISFNRISYFHASKLFGGNNYRFHFDFAMDLQGNIWTCSHLHEILAGLTSRNVRDGDETNVTNIHGIACLDETEEVEKTNEKYSEAVRKATDSNLSFSNALLACILVALIIQIIVSVIRFRFCKKITGFKTTNDQELNYLL